jgi:hypothetical protein
LAGHGAGFGQAEIEAFQAEIENESGSASMPINPLPDTSVQIVDFAPDYNAAPPTLLTGHFAADGSFVFTVNHVPANTTNYLQVATNLSSGNWQTIAAIVPGTNSITVLDPAAGRGQPRFYRWSALP